MKRNVHFLLIFSIILLYYGISGFFDEFTYNGSDLIETEGRIVALHEKSASKGASYHPIVTFQDDAGNEIIFTSRTGSHFYKNQVGKTVEVLYPAGSPGEAWIKSSFSNGLSPMMFIIGGTVLFIMWFAELYKDHK